jgi:hypothetical protein
MGLLGGSEPGLRTEQLLGVPPVAAAELLAHPPRFSGRKRCPRRSGYGGCVGPEVQGMGVGPLTFPREVEPCAPGHTARQYGLERGNPLVELCGPLVGDRLLLRLVRLALGPLELRSGPGRRTLTRTGIHHVKRPLACTLRTEMITCRDVGRQPCGGTASHSLLTRGPGGMPCLPPEAHAPSPHCASAPANVGVPAGRGGVAATS